MAYIVDEKNGKTFSVPVKIISHRQIKTATSDLALKILELLAHEPAYPKDIAKKLKMHEQKIYYHIRQLEKAGLVEHKGSEVKQGAIAKYYQLTEPAFAIVLKQTEHSPKISFIKKEYKKF